MPKNIIAASTSTIYGGTYLEYLLPELKKLFHNVTEIIFIPYARPGGITHDDYTAIAQKAFSKINISVRGL
ncbi:Type 1 glutamine amidotransferase-like domain-containing protein, partial [Dokdonia donghaensis]